MPKLYLIRGLPGSGKTTLAKDIALAVCEADMFFTDQWGEYKWHRERLPTAHKWCQDRCERYMKAGAFTIAVSNTFVTRANMDPYIELAKKYGYDVTEITMSGPLRESIHNVPPSDITRMKEQWEK